MPAQPVPPMWQMGGSFSRARTRPVYPPVRAEARDVDIDAVLSLVAYHVCVPVRMLVGPSQQKWLCRIRYAAVWAIRRACDASVAEIAEHLGGHTSMICAALGRAEELRDLDAGFRSVTDRVLVEFASGGEA